jgi:transcriptional regulator with XRE-family HTH domain
VNPNYPLTKRRIERILALLKKTDLDQNQIAEKSHMTKSTASRYVKLMVAENLAHVSRWVQPGGMFRYIRVLRAGPGASVAEPPPPMSAQERGQRWRKKAKADTERYERLRARHNARRRKIIADPLQAWIPVRAANAPRQEAA